MRFYGRTQVPESHNTLVEWLHVHTGQPLKEVDWEPPLPPLDQQDLQAQKIECSSFIPGAAKGIDALGSCTMNATTAKLSGLLTAADFLALPLALGAHGITLSNLTSMSDVVGGEELAIALYHLVTWLTGVPSEEWPTSDCGSSGPYIVQLLQRLGLIKGAQLASGAQNLVSLLQSGSVLEGTPFFYAWEEPAANGFVDGNGTGSDIQAAIDSGVAGGHETLITAIEKLSLTQTGQVIPEHTVFRVRNSWSKSWGDNGSFRIHCSTLAALSSYCDFRLLQP
jgi:hypothetical protein